jgi:hypothetical protein
MVVRLHNFSSGTLLSPTHVTLVYVTGYVIWITSRCSPEPLNYFLSMDEFTILTNRKRALIALVHSVVFLLIAFRQMIAASPAAGIWLPSTVSTGTWILCSIFAIVSAILLWLFAIARAWPEKLYFGMCAISASSGLLRTAAGDQAFHAGLYIRVVMLTSATIIGLLIVRMHSDCTADS